jgi:hypothetical protein
MTFAFRSRLPLGATRVWLWSAIDGNVVGIHWVYKLYVNIVDVVYYIHIMKTMCSSIFDNGWILDLWIDHPPA